jgi:hypothetical protein
LYGESRKPVAGGGPGGGGGEGGVGAGVAGAVGVGVAVAVGVGVGVGAGAVPHATFAGQSQYARAALKSVPAGQAVTDPPDGPHCKKVAQAASHGLATGPDLPTQ